MFILLLLMSAATSLHAQEGVKVKDISRLAGAKDNALVGYGIVTGLAGTGDTSRSKPTVQSIKNLLLRFNINIPANEVRSRNAAVVMVTSTLPPYAQMGDKLDINVTSLGDARSLLGGTLLMTPLSAANKKVYALAQGPLSVGGFSYDLNGNLMQKNHPTTANVSSGATVERGVNTDLIDEQGYVQYNLFDPDFSTASKLVEALSVTLDANNIHALDAARIKIKVPEQSRNNLVGFLNQIEETRINLNPSARVVINERTGTVVSGGGVKISPVTITHGDLNVAITTDFFVSQPLLVRNTGENVRTQVVPQTSIDVSEDTPLNVTLPDNATIADLVMALNKVKASSRDIITILQSIKRAGALHAELIVQ